MNRIVCILSIAIVTTITKADIIEFSEDVLTNLHLTNEGTSSPAIMLNSENKVVFTIRRNTATDEAHFQHTQVATQSAPNNPPLRCGNNHGVVLRENFQLFCRITSFKMRVFGKRSELQTIIFRVYFKQDGLPSLVLEIPVFLKPSKIRGVSNEGQLQRWADRNRVGLKPPFNSDDLLGAQHGDPLEMDFKWLEQLLVYQVSKASVSPASSEQPSSRTEWYVTRPLLLTKELLNSCLNAIESANFSRDVLEGSDPLERSDSDTDSSSWASSSHTVRT